MKNDETSKSSNLSKRKVNGYNSSILRMKRKQRQHDADDRLSAWVDLTPVQQLASLKGRRGESKRQVARIQAKSPNHVIPTTLKGKSA